jgi:hypothetical protein
VPDLVPKAPETHAADFARRNRLGTQAPGPQSALHSGGLVTMYTAGIVAGGLVFMLAVGWIVRGVAGTPTGKGSKPTSQP